LFSFQNPEVFYGIYSFILVVLLLILISRGEVQGDLQSWCIAASNAWGLFVLTVLKGFGLVAVPRHFWSLAHPNKLLQVRSVATGVPPGGTTRGTTRGTTILHHPAPSSPPNQPTTPQDLYRNAVLKDETRLSRLFELQDAVASARQELSAYDGASCEGCGVDGTAFAVLSQMTEKCETLHLELHGQRGNREKDIGGWGEMWGDGRCSSIFWMFFFNLFYPNGF
jgi:hypothetical protein